MRLAVALPLGLTVVSTAACNLPGSASPTALPEPTATHTPAPTVTPTWEVPEQAIVSPDGSRYAIVRDGGRLIAAADDRTEFEVARAVEITDPLWFPDSRHLAYVDQVEADSVNPTLRSRLWIADLAQQETHAVGPGFAPLLSPDGRFLAFLHGERAGDACVVAYGLGIVELNQEFLPVALIRQGQISGIPLSTEAHTFLPDAEREAVFPGEWRGERTLTVEMRWACQDEFGNDGLYAVDVERMAAEKISEADAADGSDG